MSMLRESDQTSRVTVLLGTGGSAHVVDGAVAERVDVASATVTYAGDAPVGSLTSAAKWRIQRITTSGGLTTVEYADGDGLYDNVWDNRATTVVYS